MLLTFPLNIALAMFPIDVSKYLIKVNYGKKGLLGLQFEHGSGRNVSQPIGHVVAERRV